MLLSYEIVYFNLLYVILFVLLKILYFMRYDKKKFNQRKNIAVKFFLEHWNREY